LIRSKKFGRGYVLNGNAFGLLFTLKNGSKFCIGSEQSKKLKEIIDFYNPKLIQEF
jgi:hypothetical protein